jgi:hypothetical protein
VYLLFIKKSKYIKAHPKATPPNAKYKPGEYKNSYKNLFF